MNKGDFIAELLLNKKLSIADRERLLKLAAKEFNNNTIELNKIWKELEILSKNKKENNIELTILDDSTIIHDDFVSIEELFGESEVIEAAQKAIEIPYKHNPKKLVELLKRFSYNNSPLKYTTHSWDAGREKDIFKNINYYLELAKSEYKKFSYELKNLSENLNGKIYGFLFRKDISKVGWGDDKQSNRIFFGWSSPELISACEEDLDLIPENFILPEKYQVKRGGKTLQKFKQIIDVFKNEIEIRDENSGLFNLILNKHDKFLMGFSEPKLINLENKTFYTDVQTINKALDKIFENIQKRPQHREIIYEVIDDGKDTYRLEIMQIGSFNNGKSIHDEKLKLNKGDFGDIYKSLLNLCDWSIESKFSEGPYRINYLISDDSIEAYEKIENIDGFKHILTFYK